MKVLLLAPYYPHVGHPASGVFNERIACTLQNLGNHVEVLVPRPYTPPLLSSLTPRWKSYAQIPSHEVRNGLVVSRPACLQIPKIAPAFWSDRGAFIFCKRTARQMHERVHFDAILALDLCGVGGLAWRLAEELRIPACGWGFGSDLAGAQGSVHEHLVVQALKRLDLIFYQSRELFETAAMLLGIAPARLSDEQHMVLAHGIVAPPTLTRAPIRNRIRAALGISEDQVFVLNIGRIVRPKGVFELLEAMAIVAKQDPRVACVMVGSHAGYDDTIDVQKKLEHMPLLQERVKLLPACSPDQVWEYLCAADIFAFPSHKEGMPNSLLEAMAMGVPAVAFAIPAVQEIEAGTAALLPVPVLEVGLFADAIVRLASSPSDRMRLGERGKKAVLDRFMIEQNMATALDRLGQVLEKKAIHPSAAGI